MHPLMKHIFTLICCTSDSCRVKFSAREKNSKGVLLGRTLPPFPACNWNVQFETFVQKFSKSRFRSSVLSRVFISCSLSITPLGNLEGRRRRMKREENAFLRKCSVFDSLVKSLSLSSKSILSWNSMHRTQKVLSSSPGLSMFIS